MPGTGVFPATIPISTRGYLFRRRYFASASVYFTGKDFGQIFKWSFDYIGWRTQAGYIPATFPERNRPSGAKAPFPDTVPPIPRPSRQQHDRRSLHRGDALSRSMERRLPSPGAPTSSCPLQRFSMDSPTSYGSIAKGVSTLLQSRFSLRRGCASTVNPAVCRLSYVNTVMVTGLRPNATYHFATRGVDNAGNVAQTNRPGGTARDWTFATGSSKTCTMLRSGQSLAG